jgi:hypothetical protein
LLLNANPGTLNHQLIGEAAVQLASKRIIAFLHG